MKASVKIMLSYDYSHFEVALSSDAKMDATDVNNLRKTAQRLADEAVRQYKKHKEAAERQAQDKYDRERFLREVEAAGRVPEADRSTREIAVINQRAQEDWESQFDHDYDYDEDDDEPDFSDEPDFDDYEDDA